MSILDGFPIFKFKIVLFRSSPDRMSVASLASDSETFDFSGGDEVLNVTIDGVAQPPITIQSALFTVPASATAEEVAQQIDAGLAVGTSYAQDNGRVIVATDTTGSTGSVAVAGAAATTLGFSPTSTSGSGYDDIWGGVRPQDDGTQSGRPGRRERDAETVVCQLGRTDWGSRKMSAGGVEDKTDFMFAVARKYLRDNGFLDSNGDPVFDVDTRVARILTTADEIERVFPYPPGMWITKAEDGGFGLRFRKSRINLCRFYCSKERISGE